DGRYLYLVPNTNGAFTTSDGLTARYDTTASLSLAGSWSFFDTTTAHPSAEGFHGGVFDGRYVYFSPHFSHSAEASVTRFDTQASFPSASSWTTFDVNSLSTATHDFSGAAFDGRYVYFVPGVSDFFVRYDTQSAFSSASSWEAHQAVILNAQSNGAGA